MTKRFEIKLVRLLRLAGLVVMLSGLAQAEDNTAESRQGLAASEIRRIPAADISMLEFKPPENIRGEIRLRTDVDVDDIKIEIKKNLYNLSSGERAARILESITVQTEVVREVLRIGITTPRDAEWEGSQIGVTVAFEILLPPGRIFRGDSEFFDFDLTGPLREVQIHGTYGGIQVTGVTEAADLRTEYGALSLAGAQGRIQINNHFGVTTLKDLTGFSEPLQVRSERGQLDFTKIEGAVDIRVDDAPVNISDWTVTGGNSRITSRNSPVDLDIARWQGANVMIRTDNSDVTVVTHEGFSAVVQSSISRTGGGSIRTRGLPLKITQIDRYSLEGVAGEGGGLLDIAIDDRGDIMLRGPYPRVTKDEGDSI
jgi:hypothetical protein